jgi:hypothetical protein
MEKLLLIGVGVGIVLYIAVFFASVWFSVRFQFGEESNDERGKEILNKSYGIAFPIFILGWLMIFLLDEYLTPLSLEGYKMAIWFVISGAYIIHAGSLFRLRRVS